MRFLEFKLLVEGFKEAKAEFLQSAPEDQVADYIERFRQAVKRNRAQGQERNIDYWRKQGWEQFKRFVDDSEYAISKRDLKTQRKRHGNAITLKENDRWLIVIPLDKEASCFHGKNTDWCTTKPFASHYEEYFYQRYINLIYCLDKTSGNKWAIAFHTELDKIELFDRNDNTIEEEEFQRQTGLNPHDVVKLVSSDHHNEIEDSRRVYHDIIPRVKQGMENQEISQRMEYYLVKIKNVEFILDYLRYAANKASDKFKALFVKMTADKIKTLRFDVDLDIGQSVYSAEFILSRDAFSNEQKQKINSVIVSRKDDIKAELQKIISSGSSHTSAPIRLVVVSELINDTDMFIFAYTANTTLRGRGDNTISDHVSKLKADTVEGIAEHFPWLVIYNADRTQITVKAVEAIKNEYLYDDDDGGLDTRKNVARSFLERVLEEVKKTAFVYSDKNIKKIKNMIKSDDVDEKTKEGFLRIIGEIKERKEERKSHVPIAAEFVKKYNLEYGFDAKQKAEEIIGL